MKIALLNVRVKTKKMFYKVFLDKLTKFTTY